MASTVERLKSSILSNFENTSSNNKLYTDDQNAYRDHSLFTRGFRLEFSPGIVNIPVCMWGEAKSILIRNARASITRYPALRELYWILPELSSGVNPITYRTAITALKFFNTLETYRRIGYIITNHGLKYCGGHNFVIDEDNNILMMGTIECRIGEDWKTTMLKPKIFIHPKVFSSNNLIEKGLIKTVIPFLTSSRIQLPYNTPFERAYITDGGYEEDIDIYGNSVLESPVRLHPEIMISEDAQKYLVVPEDPEMDEPNLHLNEFLSKHADWVVNVNNT